MILQNKRFQVLTANLVLGPFLWMSSGGTAWAEGCAARRDPARCLQRLADDPRLALSPEERDYLLRAAQRMEAGAPARPRSTPDRHAELQAAVDMQGMAAELDRLAAPPGRSPAGASGEKERFARAEIAADFRQRLEPIHRQILAGFAKTEKRLRAAGLPQPILDRHEAARVRYLGEIRAVFDDLELAATSQDPDEARSALAAVAERLRRSTGERKHQKVDPSRLPFRVADPVAREPGAGPADKVLAPIVGAASHTPPGPPDLEPNEDVQITPEIEALAADLGDRPLAIYDWVRNNIEFVPTYGSVQGSQMTLDAKRGNAFDTASLLIALLRAAGVPSRYVTGTVEVPVAAVQNWVGGAATPQVAQQLLGQGGIPNVGLLSGGTLTHIRLDHVWVEAFVDYIPSRGAVQRAGDTWLPMDASFKLHEFAPPSDVFTAVPISDVLDPGDTLFDVDESLGRISNVDDTLLETRLGAWAAQVDEYILANGVEQSVAGLVGGSSIIQETSTVFPGSLPYRVVARGSAVDTLPASDRHAVILNGFASEFDRILGFPSFSVRVSFPELNSRRLSLLFEPATEADAATLEAARSDGASSLPVYLVNVVPVVELDGVALGSGGSVGMGRSYFLDVVLQGPDGSTTIPYQVVAGDGIVVGVTGNGVTQEVIEKRFAANPVDNAPEYLHQVQLHYWMQSDLLGGISARSLDAHLLRLPSVGLFSSPLTVSYIFGAPRSGVYQSRIMDVKQSLIGVAGEDPELATIAAKQAGFQGSYLEGSVWDQLEGNATPFIRGISAVHLISTAANQGIPIYRITPATAAAALPMLSLSAAVESDIASAVSQGKTVLVSETDVDIGPWSGVGYIIQDETTGAGAYLISGGVNGGGLLDCLPELVLLFVLVVVLVLLLALLLWLLWWAIGALAPVLAGAGAAAAKAFAYFLMLLRGLAPLALAA